MYHAIAPTEKLFNDYSQLKNMCTTHLQSNCQDFCQNVNLLFKVLKLLRV